MDLREEFILIHDLEEVDEGLMNEGDEEEINFISVDGIIQVGNKRLILEEEIKDEGIL